MVVGRDNQLISDVNRSWRAVCDRLGDRFPPPYIWDGNYMDRANAALGLEVFEIPTSIININNVEPDEGTENYKSLKMLNNNTMTLILGGIAVPLEGYNIEKVKYVEYRMSLAESHPFYSVPFFLRDNDMFYHAHKIFIDAITHGIMNNPRNGTEMEVIPLLKRYDPVKEPLELTQALLSSQSQRAKSKVSDKNSEKFLKKVEEYSRLIKNAVSTRRKNLDGSWSEVNFSLPS